MDFRRFVFLGWDYGWDSYCSCPVGTPVYKRLLQLLSALFPVDLLLGFCFLLLQTFGMLYRNRIMTFELNRKPSDNKTLDRSRKAAVAGT